MARLTNRGAPTPPIERTGAGIRLTGPRAVVDDGFVERLRQRCSGVDTDEESLAEHGRDWWPLAMAWAGEGDVPAQPSVVARPASAVEVAGVLALCNEAAVPVTPTAGRSGVCGSSVPVFGGVALDMCGLAGVESVDRESLLLDVRPGTFGDILEDELRELHGVTLGHWPQSIALSTVGGWLACRGAGQYSTRYGKIEDMVAGLEVVLADGSVVRTGWQAPRSATGPDLTQLFVGSEGTLGVISRALLRVHPAPVSEWRAAYGFPSFAEGLDACRRIVQRWATPAVLRLYDAVESKRSLDVDGHHVLVVLDEGDPVTVDTSAAVVASECDGAGTVLDSALVDRWLEHRNDTSALQSLIQHGIVVDTTEVAARWAALPAMYDAGMAAASAVDGVLAVSAHQSHAYLDGACIYFTWAGRRPDGPAGWRDDLYREVWDAVTGAVLSHGGALSHHHGVGINRARFMRAALGGGMDVLAALKRALDPNGILNPGKLGLDSPWGRSPWP